MKNDKLLIACVCSALIGGVLIDVTDLEGVPIAFISIATVSGIMWIVKSIIKWMAEWL